MKRTFAYRNGKLIEITGKVISDRPDDYKRVMLTGTMAERVMRGYRDEENKKGSDLHRYNKQYHLNPDQIKKVWAEP